MGILSFNGLRKVLRGEYGFARADLVLIFSVISVYILNVLAAYNILPLSFYYGHPGFFIAILIVSIATAYGFPMIIEIFISEKYKNKKISNISKVYKFEWVLYIVGIPIMYVIFYLAYWIISPFLVSLFLSIMVLYSAFSWTLLSGMATLPSKLSSKKVYTIGGIIFLYIKWGYDIFHTIQNPNIKPDLLSILISLLMIVVSANKLYNAYASFISGKDENVAFKSLSNIFRGASPRFLLFLSVYGNELTYIAQAENPFIGPLVIKIGYILGLSVAIIVPSIRREVSNTSHNQVD